MKHRNIYIRQTVIDWTLLLYPYNDVHCRYRCILCCNDDNPQVRETAKKYIINIILYYLFYLEV